MPLVKRSAASIARFSRAEPLHNLPFVSCNPLHGGCTCPKCYSGSRHISVKSGGGHAVDCCCKICCSKRTHQTGFNAPCQCNQCSVLNRSPITVERAATNGVNTFYGSLSNTAPVQLRGFKSVSAAFTFREPSAHISTSALNNRNCLFCQKAPCSCMHGAHRGFSTVEQHQEEVCVIHPVLSIFASTVIVTFLTCQLLPIFFVWRLNMAFSSRLTPSMTPS